MKKVEWRVKRQDEQFVARAVNRGMDEVAARLLYNRGITDVDSAEAFFRADTGALYDPMMLNDMAAAVERIRHAVDSGEKITIYGDYDVDGITSVVILYRYFKSIGAQADYYIPDRHEEGYGLNEAALAKIKSGGTTLLITVDTGTTAVAEALTAQRLGLDLIVTDHHECKDDYPRCTALINPKRRDSTYPFKDLAGVGVTFKLICALDGDWQKILSLYGDIVAVGTVADIMSLTGENRALVSYGLKLLASRPSAGIRALLECAGKYGKGPINAGVISFQLAPRLNAAGRIGDPATSVHLLLCDRLDEARPLAQTLCEENRTRQAMEQSILADVQLMLRDRDPQDKIIVLGSQNWHQGVIGIVASRICEKYGKPCVLVCFEGDKAKGSARSVSGVSIFELLSRSSAHLERFGGHDMAAGLTLRADDFDAFVADITANANSSVTEDMLIPVVEADMELASDDIVPELVRMLCRFEPFGAGNPQPLFFVRGLRVSDVFAVGSGRHVKLILTDGRQPFQAMCFGVSLSECCAAPKDTVDIMCTIGENTFNGVSSIVLNVKNIRVCGQAADLDRLGDELYGAYVSSGIVTPASRVSRGDMISFYKYILRQAHAQITSYDSHALARSINAGTGRFNYCKLRFCIDTLSELGLITCEGSSNISINISDTRTKVDLHRSATWNRVGDD